MHHITASRYTAAAADKGSFRIAGIAGYTRAHCDSPIGSIAGFGGPAGSPPAAREQPQALNNPSSDGYFSSSSALSLKVLWR
jgi:hypothetical protein